MIRLGDDTPHVESEEEPQLLLEARQVDLDRRRRRARELARRRRRAQIRRNRLIAAVVAVGTALGLWGTLGAADAASHRHGATVRSSIVLTSTLQPVSRVPGRLGAFPWPAKGQGAIAVLGTGLMTHSPATPVVPIASLTKMMTAYLILLDHPLREGTDGPTFTMGQADVAAWVHASQTDESNVPVVVGEHLTEQQLLEALLIPSADNVADRLAIWDAGTIAAFVQKMNLTAAKLGLTATHYADASGVNPASRSDAPDQAMLAAALMQNPVVRAIVSKPTLPFPVAGTIRNYNPGLGVDGIVGVKSGFTSHALGCLATAAYRDVAGHQVLVVAVSLGQSLGLGQAAQVDEGLLNAAGRSLVGYRLSVPSTGLGTLVSGGASTPLALAGTPPLLAAWPGLRLRLHLQPLGTAVGTVGTPIVGDLVVRAPSGVLASVPVSARSAAAATTTTLAASSSTTTTLGSTTPASVGGTTNLPATSLPATSLPVGG